MQHYDAWRHGKSLGVAAIVPMRARGEDRQDAKLNNAAVRVIRKMARKMTQQQLASRFGVSSSLIRHVLAGRCWDHVR